MNLGVSLSLTALLLALLSLDWNTFPFVIFKTVTDVSMISVMFAAFGIMVISQLYKETKAIGRLSDSLSKMIHNSKLVVAVLPAIIGLLPVAGGALMSAPLVESEADKLGLSPEKKTYVNIWFRHTIFPVYPISQVLILTEKLTGATVTSIIIRQIPVVISMIVVGYFLSFWRVKKVNEEEFSSTYVGLELKKFIVAFSPILVTIIIAVLTSLDVSVAILAGIFTLLLITRPSLATIKKPFNNSATYSIAFAVFGAFFLRNIVERAGISQIFGSLAIDGSNGLLLLLILVPAALAFFVGSPLGAIAISVSILGSVMVFNSKSAALLYIVSYLSYVIAPTHLCLVLTTDYFKGSFQKIYRYLIPSVTVSLATAVMLYVLT